MTARPEPRALGDAFQIELAVAEHFAGEGDAQTMQIVDRRDTRMLPKEAGDVAFAGAGDLGHGGERPVAGRVGGDGVLHAMQCGVQMIAAFEPRRQLRVCACPAGIDHHLTRNGRCTQRIGGIGDEREHEVEAGRHACACPDVAVVDVQTVISDPGARGEGA